MQTVLAAGFAILLLTPGCPAAVMDCFQLLFTGGITAAKLFFSLQGRGM